MNIIIPKNGILSKSQTRTFKRMLITAKIQENLNKLFKKIGIKTYKDFNLENIRVPDSKISKMAVELVMDESNEMLFNHCFRSFYWSAGFSLSEGLQIDEELLFVSSILHDIGLTDNHKHVCSSQCFASYGGAFAEDFLIENEFDAKRTKLAQNIIALHLNPIVDKGIHGNEAYCLSKGVIMDVIGANSFQLDNDFLQSVIKQYHRTHFIDEITRTMEEFNHKKIQGRKFFIIWDLTN
ncbi:HD domain-containing protein [Aquimarina algiphila]|uniref:HD domain-containing protein n=1 Tax=Aquimarina algiphila TaxID=2047982 RepID=UPI002490D3C1|nr:HD domain-containing protein [Aquimarina algiphila]